MTVKLLNKTYELSPRITRDYNNFMELAVKFENKRALEDVVLSAYAIVDSLRAVYSRLKWWEIKKKVHYAKFQWRKVKSLDQLILKEDPIVILTASNKLAELEGVKASNQQTTGKIASRAVKKGLIAMHFHIDLDKVEDDLITDYRLKLFTIFNSQVIYSGYGDFQYSTYNEEVQELDELVTMYKKKGYFNATKN